MYIFSFTHFHHYFPSLPPAIASFHRFFLISIFFILLPLFFLSCTLLPLSLLFSLFSSIHSHYSLFPFLHPLIFSHFLLLILLLFPHLFFFFLSFHIHIQTPCNKHFPTTKVCWPSNKFSKYYYSRFKKTKTKMK